MRTLALAVIGVLLAGCALDDDSSSDEDAVTGSVATGPTFNNPLVAADQNAIVDHLGDLIDGAGAGSRIQLSSFTFGDAGLATKLIDAKNRGVIVQVVLDYTTKTNHEGSLVLPTLEGLGTYKPGDDDKSWYVLCPEHHACLAKAIDANSVNHNKFYLFSKTLGSPDVVVQTSANLTTWDRKTAFNDALTVVGNTDLYNGYQTYFRKLRDAGHAGVSAEIDNYNVEVAAGRAKVYFFPRNGDANDDVVVNIMSTIDNKVDGKAPCHGNTSGFGTSDGRTIVRVAMHQLDRAAVAQKLWDLQNEGCDVTVVFAQLQTSGSSVLDQLEKPTAHGKIKLYHLSGTHVVHSKYMIVEGTYDGKNNQKLVFTGSHTYVDSALHSNDESLLKYDDATIYDSYRTHFATVVAAANAAQEKL